MVVCVGRGADLHMAQLLPLPLTISCSSKSTLVLPFWFHLCEKGWELIIKKLTIVLHICIVIT